MTKNLLKIGIIKNIIKNKFFPDIFRLMNLISTVFMIYIGWGLIDDRLRYINLTSFLIWIIWWPGIIIAAIFTGRGWCTVCHQKLISDKLGKYGLHYKVPEYIQKYGTSITIISVIGVFALHSTVSSYEVSHFAGLSSIYLAVLLVYVTVVALLFEKGIFCKSFCPLVGFLGIYSRCCPIELRSEDQEKCKECKNKECKKYCPNNLYIREMDSQDQEGCLLCLECAKHCPHDNVSISFRSFFKGIWDTTKRNSAGTLSVIILLGIMIAELGEEYKPFDDMVLIIPDWLSGIFGFSTIFDSATGGFQIWDSLWTLIIVPTIIIGFSGMVARSLSRKHEFKGILWNIIKMYSLGLVPLILSLHTVKLVEKFQGNIGYLPYAINNLDSVILAVPTPDALLPSPIMGLLSILFITIFGIGGSLYSIWRISKFYRRSKNDKNSIPFMILILLLGIIFIFIIYKWLIG